MAMIEISNLKSAGSDLFTDAESFLTELQPTDSSQVIGGSGGSKKKKSKKKSKGYPYYPYYPCYPCCH
jgi:hypothetical protein